MRIQVTDYYIQLLATNTDPELLAVIDALPNIKKMRKRDTYRCSLRKLPEILRIARGIDSILQIPEGRMRELYDEEMQRRSRTRLLKDLGPDMTSDWLWPHQCLGIELAQVNRRFNFYYDTRTGKTLMCLRIMYDRLRAGEARRCLVICPASIVQSWLDDAAEYFPMLKVAAFYGDAKQQQKALNTPAHVVIWATSQVAANVELLKSLRFDMCVFDESSKIKSYKTKIAKASRALSMTIPSWYNLSATPAPNGKEEYYTQMMCLDPYVFDPAVTNFKRRYFNNLARSHKYDKLVLKPEMEQEFTSIIEDYSLYVDQAVMPTAGKEWHAVKYPLLPSTAKTYDRMCKKACVELEGVKITADMSAAVRAKLNQITSGFIMDTEARKENAILRKLGEDTLHTEVYRVADTSRIELLAKLLKKLGDKKVVIWANYKEEFTMIRELLGDRARYVRGGTTTEEKNEYIYKDFKRGPIQYLVAHPMSIGMGINLTEAHTAIYYSLNDSWEALKQSSERIYGHINVQPHKCHYYVLMAENTVDELIYNNVTNKRDASLGLLEHMKARALNA
jgi:SNF2 family DNA or RNA helicase